ncbi:Hypothetical predicted protein, partial [Paramuricea clavata]
MKIELLITVLFCLLPTCTLAAQNTTSNHTEPEEQHSFTEELLEHFFEDYGDENGNIIASQLCNFTQKLSACSATTSIDPHGHGAEENVVEETHEELMEHGEDEEEHEEEEGQCAGVYKVLRDKNYTETSRINEDEFSKLCPALYALFVSQIKEQTPEESVESEDKLSTGE